MPIGPRIGRDEFCGTCEDNLAAFKNPVTSTGFW